MRIRRAEFIDFSLLAQMNKRLIEDERHPNKMKISELEERMKTWLRGDYTGYLAEMDHVPLAYCLYRDDGDYYYMRQLYVEREHRRKGIAKKLLDWMFLNDWSDKRVRTDVLAHNKDAIIFYEKYGFQVGCLRMEKGLSQQ